MHGYKLLNFKILMNTVMCGSSKWCYLNLYTSYVILLHKILFNSMEIVLFCKWSQILIVLITVTTSDVSEQHFSFNVTCV